MQRECADDPDDMHGLRHSNRQARADDLTVLAFAVESRKIGTMRGTGVTRTAGKIGFRL
jgi:hypothetical protein